MSGPIKLSVEMKKLEIDYNKEMRANESLRKVIKVKEETIKN